MLLLCHLDCCVTGWDAREQPTGLGPGEPLVLAMGGGECPPEWAGEQ